ncbi:MAG: ATP-binding cassette domain-containing protein [Spartobacteria bacterium]|nr:ATP-binding cassette domain-containing protein [Spartobacteria bacterium]
MLELQNITVLFHPNSPDEVRALDNLSLSIQPHTFVVVIGSNGSGKSTLLNTLAGSLTPVAGTLRLGGRDITRRPEHRRAALIGRVFQNPFSGTAPHLTVAENLALAVRRGASRGLRPALNARLKASFRERLRDLNLGLEDRLDAEIGTLSGGQRQAITLLMATWQHPELLLLDEHTAALDPRTADQITRLTERIIREERLTALMVTHSMQQAVTLGDRLLMMHRGRLVYDAAGPEKRRLRVEHLHDKFQALRRADLLDPSAATLLHQAYV